MLLSLITLDCILVYVNGSCDLRSARYHNCALYVVNACLGTLILWGIIRKVLEIRLREGISYLSIYSISFLCLNQFVIIQCERFLPYIMNNNSLTIVITQKCIILIMTIIVCIVINELIKRSRLKFMIGANEVQGVKLPACKIAK